MGNGKNNLKFALVFLERAKGDLKSAKDLLKNKDYADAVYHSQQGAEKAAKVILILENTFVRDHIISGFFGGVTAKFKEQEKIREIIKTLQELEVHWVKTRYPLISERKVWNPLKEYKQKDAREAIKKGTFVLQGIIKLLKERYKIIK